MKKKQKSDNKINLFDRKYNSVIINFYSLLKEMEGWVDAIKTISGDSWKLI